MAAVRTKDIVLQAGGEILNRHGVWVIPGAGRGRTEEFKETATRASVATLTERGGVGRHVGQDVPRQHWIKNAVTGLYEPYLLLEASRTNLIENGDYEADAVGSLANVSTIVRDATNVYLGSWALKVTTQNSSSSGVFVHNRAGTRIPVTVGQQYSFPVWLYAPAASVGKTVKIRIEWWSSAPAFLSATETIGIVLVAGWQRLNVTGTAPASTATADPFIGGDTAQGVWDFWIDAVQFEASTGYPSSPIATGTVAATRALDAFSVPYPHGATDPIFVYEKFRERGEIQGNGTIRRWRLGSNADGTGNPALYITFNTQYGTRLNIGGNVTSAVIATVPAYDDIVELLVTMTSAGLMQLTIALNGGAPIVGTAGGAQTLPAKWSDRVFYLAGAGDYLNPLARLIVGRKNLPTLAEVRAFVAATP